MQREPFQDIPVCVSVWVCTPAETKSCLCVVICGHAHVNVRIAWRWEISAMILDVEYLFVRVFVNMFPSNMWCIHACVWHCLPNSSRWMCNLYTRSSKNTWFASNPISSWVIDIGLKSHSSMRVSCNGWDVIMSVDCPCEKGLFLQSLLLGVSCSGVLAVEPNLDHPENVCKTQVRLHRRLGHCGHD